MRTLQAPLIGILLVDELRELFVSWLSYEDKVWLWICALEWELDDDVARYLRYEATNNRFPTDAALVEMALGCGCFNALWHILEKAQVDDKRPASSVKWMEWLEDHHPRMYSGHVMERAAARGDLALVEWLHSTCEYNTHGAVSAAASQGHLEVAQWMLDHRVSSDIKQWLADRLISSKPDMQGHVPQDNIHVNVRLGELGLMMWTVNGSVPFFCVRDPKATKRVVFVNGSDIVKSSGSSISKPDVFVFAVHIGDLDLLQRISEDKGTSRDTNIPKAATLAARLGRLDILQWLFTQRVGNFPVQVLYEAARSGRLDVLEWVIACGRTESFDLDILLLAGVASASRQVVEWICALFPLTKLTTEPSRLSKIADNVPYWEDLKDTKVVEVLEWLCVNDRVQPSWWLIEMACRAGKVSLLRDLIKDVTVDETMASSLIQGLKEACLRGHRKIVVYLTEEMGMLCRESYESAMSQGHRGVAEYLLRMNPQHYPPLSSTTALRMVYDGHVDLVEWEHSTGRMQCLDRMWRREVERIFRTESLRDSISRYRSVKVNDLRRMRVVAQWLLSHETFGADVVYFVAKWAAQRCQTDLFRLAITTIKSRYLCCATYPTWRLPFDIGRLLDLVIEYTTLGDIAQMLLELHPPAISPRVIQWAIECEQTELLQRWGEKVPPPTLAIAPTSPLKVVYRRREKDPCDRITTRVAVCVAVWGVMGYFVYSV